MRRYLVHRFGGPEALSLERAPEPDPGPGEVRVDVRAIGLNFADLAQRAGRYPNPPPRPYTPGLEAAGVVDAVGPGAPPALEGRRVMAVPIYGSHAEKLCLSANKVLEMPEAMSFEEGASFGVMFLTAQYALFDLGRARRGERCVLTAAAGGVGTAVLQLAREAGVEVLAVVGRREKRALARELGAAEVCGYDEAAERAAQRFGQVDLVLDSVGGTFFRPHWKLLAPGGRYVLYGFAEAMQEKGASVLRAARGLASMGVVVPFNLVGQNRTLAGFNLSLVPDEIDRLREHAEHLLELWRAGRIRAVLGRTFAFEEAAEAHRFMASRASVGRVVIRR